jgi:hypothetical protein
MLKATFTLARLAPLERKAFNLDDEIDVRDLSDDQIIRLMEQNR